MEGSLNLPKKIRTISASSGRSVTLDLSTWSGETIQRFIELMYLISVQREIKSRTYVEAKTLLLEVTLPSLNRSKCGRNSEWNLSALPSNSLERTLTLSLLVETLRVGLSSATQELANSVGPPTYRPILSPGLKSSPSTILRRLCATG